MRDEGAWEEWLLYVLDGIETTARHSIEKIGSIAAAFMTCKHEIRDRFKFYSQDLINNLFSHPYTKIEFLVRELGVSRITASKYLDAIAETGILRKEKVGRNNYYINVALFGILSRENLP